MGNSANKQVATLNTGLALTPEQVATLKPKILREHLKRTLNLLSEDWQLHLIASELAECFGTAFAAVSQGVRVTKGTGETTDYSFRKGSFTDKATKKVAKFFYTNEAVLRRYVDALDLAIGSASKKPLILAGAYGNEMDENNGEETSELYFTLVSNTTPVFVTDTEAEFTALVGINPVVNRDTLAVRLLNRVAEKYGLTVFTSDTTVGVSGRGDDVSFVSFAVLEAKHKF